MSNYTAQQQLIRLEGALKTTLGNENFYNHRWSPNFAVWDAGSLLKTRTSRFCEFGFIMHERMERAPVLVLAKAQMPSQNTTTTS